LFTATSATCVTGLIVYDTYLYFNILGQAVIISLIQLGGLGVVTLTSFFYLLIGKKMGLRTAHLAQESVNSDERIDTVHLIKMIVILTFLFEAVGALILLTQFVPEYGAYGVFMSIFFAISSYCNAGFDLLGMNGAYSSLISVRDNPVITFTVMGLIVCGGLGFVVWQDLYNYRRTKKLMLHTKIVLITTTLLIGIGFLGILIMEWNNPATIGSMDVAGKMHHSLFQSITARTAGYNTIDLNAMTEISKCLTTLLMFIGAAPGSTGGGIKITTMVVLLMTVVSIIRGRTETTIMKRRVDKMVVYKSLAVASLAGVLIAITTGTLILTNDSPTGINALFETVSAFGTVGLSVGVSGTAGLLSKIMLIFTMFLGRCGPVAFALSISLRNGARATKQIVPEGKIWVG
ncbi:MAG: potassium transporter TrkG, partial [Oscillospiraceae bacterium]